MHFDTAIATKRNYFAQTVGVIRARLGKGRYSRGKLEPEIKMNKTLNIDLWHASKKFIESRTNKHTQRAYRQQLIKFIGWLVEERYSPTLSSINPVIVVLYRDAELARGASPATVALNVKVIRKLDAWLPKHLAWIPQLVEVKPPNVPQPEYKGVSEGIRLGIIQQALSAPRDFESLRLATLVYCYAGLGMRAVEPLNLLPSQLSDDFKTIENVKMKFCIYRSKVIPDSHSVLFREYAQARGRYLNRKKVYDSQLPLFFSNKLGPISERTANRWTSRFDATPRQLRHSYAQALLTKTGNIRLLAYEMGHTNLTTTMHYTVPSSNHRQKYHEELYGG